MVIFTPMSEMTSFVFVAEAENHACTFRKLVTSLIVHLCLDTMYVRPISLTAFFFSCLDLSDRNKTCLPSPPESYIARTLKMTLFVSMRGFSFRTEENSVVSLVESDGCKKMNPHT